MDLLHVFCLVCFLDLTEESQGQGQDGGLWEELQAGAPSGSCPDSLPPHRRPLFPPSP